MPRPFVPDHCPRPPGVQTLSCPTYATGPRHSNAPLMTHRVTSVSNVEHGSSGSASAARAVPGNPETTNAAGTVPGVIDRQRRRSIADVMPKVLALLAGEGLLEAPSAACFHAALARPPWTNSLTDAQRELLCVFFSLVVATEMCEWSHNGEQFRLVLSPSEIASWLNESRAQVGAWRRMFPRTREMSCAIEALSAAIRRNPLPEQTPVTRPDGGAATQRADMATLRGALAYCRVRASLEKAQRQYAISVTELDIAEQSPVRALGGMSLGASTSQTTDMQVSEEARAPSTYDANDDPLALQRAQCQHYRAVCDRWRRCVETHPYAHVVKSGAIAVDVAAPEDRVRMRRPGSNESIVAQVLPQVLAVLVAEGRIDEASEPAFRQALQMPAGQLWRTPRQVALLKMFLLLVAPGRTCEWRVNGKRFFCRIDQCDVATFLHLSRNQLRNQLRHADKTLVSAPEIREALRRDRLGVSKDRHVLLPVRRRLPSHPPAVSSNAGSDLSNNAGNNANTDNSEASPASVAGPSWSSEAMAFLRSSRFDFNPGSC